MRDMLHATSDPAASLSSSLLWAVLDACSEGVLVMAPDGVALGVNDAFCRLYRLEREQIVGKHFLEYSNDLVVRRFESPITMDAWVTPQALKGETVSGVVQYVRNSRTGHEFVGRYAARPFPSREEFLATIMTVEDITDFRHAEASVEGALSAAEVSTFRVDLTERRIWADQRLAQFYGFPPETVEGGRVEALYEPVHPDDLPRVLEGMRQSARDGSPFSFDFRITRPDGTLRWLLLRGRTVLGPDGHALERLGSVVDITERRLAEEGARSSTERYEALASLAATVVFTADASGHLTEFPVLRGLAQAKEEYLGTGWLAAVHPDDRPAARQAWRHALATGERYEAICRLEMADRAFRWHRVQGTRVLEPDGTTREWIGACFDVHERVSQERILRALDDFTAASREIDDPFDVMALVQRLVGHRLGASRVIYAEPTEGGRGFVGVPHYCDGCEDLNGKLPVSGFASEVSQTLRSGDTIILDDVAAAVDGQEGLAALLKVNVAALVCVPVKRDGKVVSILGVHHRTPRLWSSDEVELVRSLAERCWTETERARASQARVVGEQRLRRILEAATVGVIVNDAEGTAVYANPPLLRMLGYAEEDVRAGRLTWNAIQIPERRPIDDRALEQLRATGSCDPYETELRTKDGRRVPVYVGAAFVPEEHGGELGAGFVTDLSDLKATERALVALNEQLDERVRERTAELTRANRDLEEFSYSVAHDLRAPLRAIVSTSQILLEDLKGRLTEEERSYLVRQSTNAKRLARIIDDLLAFARLSRQEVQRRSFDFSGIAEAAAADVLSRGWAHPPAVEVQPGLVADGDPRLVGYVLTNLLENACKFSPDGGTVWVGERDGVYCVADQGIGFDMEHHDKLFVAFERLVDQERFPGTGVGLANVMRIVERHHGRIWAESTPGHGATFFFTLGEAHKP